MFLRVLPLAFVLFLVDICSCCNSQYGPGSHSITLTSGRQFTLYIPDLPSSSSASESESESSSPLSLSSSSSYSSSPPPPFPLLIHIHGCGVLKTTGGYRVDDPTYEWQLTHMNETANDDKQGTRTKYAIAYPVGTKAINGTCTSLGGLPPLGFNAGSCCGVPSSVDDVGFFTALIQHLSDTADCLIDTNRTFASGFSNGAMLAHRLACQANNLFRGVAAVEGNIMFGGDFLSCPKVVSTPRLALSDNDDDDDDDDDDDINDNNDNNDEKEVAVVGTPSSVFLMCGTIDTVCSFLFASTIAFWRSQLSCSATAPAALVYNSSTTLCYEWSNCEGGTFLHYCTVQNLGHCWSGEDDALRVDICPPQSKDNIDVSDYILDLFAKKRN